MANHIVARKDAISEFAWAIASGLVTDVVTKEGVTHNPDPLLCIN